MESSGSKIINREEKAVKLVKDEKNVTRGVEHWKKVREEWTKHSRVDMSHMQQDIDDMDDEIDDLMNDEELDAEHVIYCLRRYVKFPDPIPLKTIVSLLNILWDDEFV
ncbi:hypothetical protein AAMO2058_000851700 [Amorphochlora amoebiformis]